MSRKRNIYDHVDKCDCCGKFVPLCNLYTLPEELYPLLDGDNEFSVCMPCTKGKTTEDWRQWVAEKRVKKEGR